MSNSNRLTPRSPLQRSNANDSPNQLSSTLSSVALSPKRNIVKHENKLSPGQILTNGLSYTKELFFARLREFRKLGTLTDLTFNVFQDRYSASFRVHRVVIAASEDNALSNMVTSSMREGTNSVIDLRDTDIEAFSYLIDIFYADASRFNSIDVQMFFRIIMTSRQYGMMMDDTFGTIQHLNVKVSDIPYLVAAMSSIYEDFNQSMIDYIASLIKGDVNLTGIENTDFTYHVLSSPEYVNDPYSTYLIVDRVVATTGRRDLYSLVPWGRLKGRVPQQLISEFYTVPTFIGDEMPNKSAELIRFLESNLDSQGGEPFIAEAERFNNTSARVSNFTLPGYAHVSLFIPYPDQPLPGRFVILVKEYTMTNSSKLLNGNKSINVTVDSYEILENKGERRMKTSSFPLTNYPNLKEDELLDVTNWEGSPEIGNGIVKISSRRLNPSHMSLGMIKLASKFTVTGVSNLRRALDYLESVGYIDHDYANLVRSDIDSVPPNPDPVRTPKTVSMNTQQQINNLAMNPNVRLTPDLGVFLNNAVKTNTRPPFYAFVRNDGEGNNFLVGGPISSLPAPTISVDVGETIMPEVDKTIQVQVYRVERVENSSRRFKVTIELYRYV